MFAQMGEDPAIATLALPEGETLAVAAVPEQSSALLGPFVALTEKP